MSTATTTTKTLVIVACSATKRASTCRAADLYDASQLFRSSRKYAEREGSAGWLIASAKHGLVSPDEQLAPYDCRMPSNPTQRRAWAFCAQADVARWLSEHPQHVEHGRIIGLRVVVLAGRDYVDALRHTSLGRLIESPLDGLQIGERLRWLAIANN